MTFKPRLRFEWERNKKWLSTPSKSNLETATFHLLTGLTDGRRRRLELRMLNESVQIRAVRLPVLLIELFLQSGWDYRVRTCCISMLKLRQRMIGHCAGLTRVITGSRIVVQMLGIRRMHCWQLEWHDTGRGPARRWRLIP